MSRYEFVARQRKVAGLLSRIPAAHSLTERESLAERLAQAPTAWRESFAHAAGANPPSETTWQQVVAGVRNRPIATEAS